MRYQELVDLEYRVRSWAFLGYVFAEVRVSLCPPVPTTVPALYPMSRMVGPSS